MILGRNIIDFGLVVIENDGKPFSLTYDLFLLLYIYNIICINSLTISIHMAC